MHASIRRRFALVALLPALSILSAACADDATGPSPAAGAPAARAATAAEEEEEGPVRRKFRGVDTIMYIDYVPCVRDGKGEFVRARAVIERHGQIWRDWDTRLKANYHSRSTGEATGLTSGRLYLLETREHEATNLRFIDFEEYSMRGTAHWTTTHSFTDPATGESFAVEYLSRLVINANGEIIVDRSEMTPVCN